MNMKKWTKTRPSRWSKKPAVTGWGVDLFAGVAKSASKPVKGRRVKR